MSTKHQKTDKRVIRKRTAAKALNTLFQNREVTNRRTAQRLERLRKELKEGKAKTGNLRASDVISHANELLQSGATLTEVNLLVGKRYHVTSDPKNPPKGMVAVLREYQEAFDEDLDPRVWRVFNVDPDKVAV